jgi:hypothetical protein
MASANLNAVGKNEWMLARPWPWIGVGFAVTLWSWLWTVAFGETASDYRVIVLAVGLFLTGVGVWLRWRDRQCIYVRLGRLPLVTLLGCVFALSCVGTIGVFVLSFIVPDRIPVKSGALFVLMISAAPLAYFAARRTLRREGGSHDREIEEEIALAFAASAVICILGSLTLSAEASDWDTMRLFMRVATAVCIYASALVLVSKAVRRIMVSLLIGIHFAGISTAVLAVPPAAPWIIQQAWMRLFRPYLEFVYLNNAYHFFAPEPGPSCYVWFRIIYESPDGVQHGMWYKIPQIDEKGRITHRVALEYQRYLSLTEGIGPPQALPSEYEFNPEKQIWEQRPIYRNRLILLQPEGQLVGVKAPDVEWIIPLDPEMAPPNQVVIPNHTAKQLLKSYAKFIAIKFKTPPEPGKEDWKYVSVKVYRVVHWIPPVAWFTNNLPPTDPWLYRPFYFGNYRADGSLIDDGDPYLYWLLPSRRLFPSDPDSKIFDYCRLHAGDPKWVRDAKSESWREPGPQELQIVVPKKKLEPDPPKK